MRRRRVLAGLVLALTALASSAGCARPDWIKQTLVTVDVTGVWEGTLAGSGQAYRNSFRCTFNLEQQGSRVAGSVRQCGSEAVDRGS